MSKVEFEQLFHTYYAALVRYGEGIVGSKTVAEDLVEDVFLNVLNKSPNFSSGGERPYLYTCVRNACVNCLKKQSKNTNLSMPVMEAVPSDEDNIETTIIKNEVRRQLYDAITLLPAQCGKIMLMTHIEGIPSKQVAAQLGISVATVDSQKSRGRMLLRKLLSKPIFVLIFSKPF